jgi:hypothetical protein
MIDVIAAWRQHLLDDPQIAQIVGDRVFAHIAPRGHELPVIIIAPDTQLPQYTFSGITDIEHTITTRVIDMDRYSVNVLLDRVVKAATNWDDPPHRTSIVDRINEENQTLDDGSEQMYYIGVINHRIMIAQ